MYVIRADHCRTTICTASVQSAIAHLLAMAEAGQNPVASDFAGRRLSLAELRRKALVRVRSSVPSLI